MWSYNGIPVDPQSSSYDVSTREIVEDGEVVVVNKLVVHGISSAVSRVTFTCKPQDDILNLDADEIDIIITSESSKFNVNPDVFIGLLSPNNFSFLVKYANSCLMI